MSSIISHVSIGASCEAFAEMLVLYDAVAEKLGAKRLMVICKKEGDEELVRVPKGDLCKVEVAKDGIVAVAYGKYYPEFWVNLPLDNKDATAGNGTHISFTCRNKAMVDQVYEAAIAKGAKCNGPPGPRPAYGEQYYGAFFIDQCGNKMEATFFDLGILNYCAIL